MILSISYLIKHRELTDSYSLFSNVLKPTTKIHHINYYVTKHGTVANTKLTIKELFLTRLL